ncbi:unnamed protein product [Parnassius apollo]|uniref:(apollo) hypothetical protein n=1 Tax=Parnassius apollo TaxID=110799 RepID=A0A8S3XIA9_PARAO|nr:unnamed protein product [Parnassius apollo]
MKAMKSMKVGKAAGYDRVSLEMLGAGEDVVAGLLYTLFNLCWELKRVPGGRCKAVIVPIYNGKGSQQDCKNYRGISLLSIVGKLYAKVLIERVIKETEEKIWDEKIWNKTYKINLKRLDQEKLEAAANVAFWPENAEGVQCDHKEEAKLFRGTMAQICNLSTPRTSHLKRRAVY